MSNSILNEFSQEYYDNNEMSQHLNSVKQLSHLMRISTLLQLEGAGTEEIAETMEQALQHVKRQAALVCEAMDMTGDIRSSWQYAFYCGQVAELLANDWQPYGRKALDVDYATALSVLTTAKVGDGLPPVWYQSPHEASLQATLASAVCRAMAGYRVYDLHHKDSDEVARQLAYAIVESSKYQSSNINLHHGIGDRHEAALMQMFIKFSGPILHTEWIRECKSYLREHQATPTGERVQNQGPVDLSPIFNRYRDQLSTLASSSAESLRYSKSARWSLSNV